MDNTSEVPISLTVSGKTYEIGTITVTMHDNGADITRAIARLLIDAGNETLNTLEEKDK